MRRVVLTIAAERGMITVVSASDLEPFSEVGGPDVEHWRRIVLFGRNVASYKFALAKSLLEIAGTGTDRVSIDELAVPFSRHVCEHLARVDRQGNFSHSRFLDACRFYNAGRISAEELQTATALRGFVNVIDTFHIVGRDEVPIRFYVDDRRASGGLVLTDELLDLARSNAAPDLSCEAESRWRLVEEAWDAPRTGSKSSCFTTPLASCSFLHFSASDARSPRSGPHSTATRRDTASTASRRST